MRNRLSISRISLIATVLLHMAFFQSMQAQWPPPAPANSNWDLRVTTSVEGPFQGGARVAVVGPNGNIYVAGNFSPAPGQQRAKLAQWTGQQWITLADRFEMGASNVEIEAIAVNNNGDVYVCGLFSSVVYNNGANTVPVNRVARWDGTQWSQLAGGVSSFPSSLAIAGSEVYVGNIDQVFDANGVPTTVQKIARWNMNTNSWSAVGTGISGGMAYVGAMVSDGPNVYVGGNYATAGGVTANHIARWDGLQWHALGQGLYSATSVYATELALNAANQVIVSGSLDGGRNPGGAQVPGKILRWDGSQWINESAGLIQGQFDYVSELEVDGWDKICVYGYFGVGMRIARGTAGNWTTVGIMSGEYVGALAGRPGRVQEGLYMGGLFTRIIDPSVPQSHNIMNNAQYHEGQGQGWSQMRDLSAPPGVIGVVFALSSGSNWDPGVERPDFLYIGGLFTSVANIPALNIARFNGTTWTPLGGGLNGPVYAMVEARRVLYVGGEFTQATNPNNTVVNVRNVAAWNTVSNEWMPVGGGVNGPVYALDAYHLGSAQLFVGGNFEFAYDGLGDSTTVNSIAEFRHFPFPFWEVHALGQGVTGIPRIVRAIGRHGPRYTPEDDMYIGGTFTGVVTGTGTTIPTANIARWNINTSTWRNVGQGVNGNVHALAYHFGSLPPVWVGGDFTTGTNDDASTVTSPHFILWNDGSNQWNRLQGGTNGPVYAIERIHTTHYDGVFFGGNFTLGLYPPPGVIQRPISRVGLYVLGERPPSQPIRPDWNQRADGTDGPVFALHQLKPCLPSSGENVYVGGSFQLAGGGTANGIARWRYMWRNPYMIVSSSAGVRRSGNNTGGGVSAEARIYSCNALNNSPGPTSIVLVDSLGFRDAAQVDSLPVMEYIGLDIYGEGPTRPLLFTTDSFYVSEAAPGIMAILGVEDTTLFAPNPDGRSLALRVANKHLPIVAENPSWVNVMFLHAVTDAPAIDVGIQGGGTLVHNLRFGDASDSVINLTPTNYTFEIRRTSNGQLLGTYPFNLTGNSGDVLVLGLTGFLDPASNQNGPAMELNVYSTGTVILTDVEDRGRGVPPNSFALHQNYPNPFNPATRIPYSVQVSGFTSLKVYDVLGREVATLVNEVKQPGEHSVTWDAQGMATGVYFYKLQAGNFVQTKKLLLLR